MAYMTENTNLQRALLRRIDEAGNGKVDIRESARVEEMRMDEGKRSVALRLGQDAWVRAGVVVGADGPNSPVRKFSEIESYGHAYPTHGIVATLEHAPLAASHTAFQRFLPTGPLAFLPMTPTSATMVWSTRPELAAAYKALGPSTLKNLVNLGLYASESELDRLNQAILGHGISHEMIEAESLAVLSRLTMEEIKMLPPPVTNIVPKSVASFPYRLAHAESYIGQRTALVGDAAHTTHPLAGQGLNMGLADVKSLTEVWDHVGRCGGDLGAYTSMLAYPRDRYPANHLLLSTVDKLHHIFGTRMPIINWIRSTGMDVINELTPVKKALMERVGAEAEVKRVSAYERGADVVDGWQTAKNLAGLAASGVGELVGNGARRLLEKTEPQQQQQPRSSSSSSSSSSNPFATASSPSSARRTLHTSARLSAPKPPPLFQPGPPRLAAAEQAEFEALVKQAQGAGTSLEQARAQLESEQGVVHPDMRRKPEPEFEGDTNPRTGEVGGPKRDPFLAGAEDWQYGGRVTDF